MTADNAVSLTARAAGHVTAAARRVERTTRESHNVTPLAWLGPQAAGPTVTLIAEVTDVASPGSGNLHPAKLYRLVSDPLPPLPPGSPAWLAVNGDFYVKPLPGQTLKSGDKGVAVLVGVYEGDPVYALGFASALPEDCRPKLLNLQPEDQVTFRFLAGNGHCANIRPQTIRGYYSATAGGHVGARLLRTAVGGQPVTLKTDEATGQPVVVVGYPASGSYTPLVLPWIRCVDGEAEFAGGRAPWCDSAAQVACPRCAAGAPTRYLVTAAGGTGHYARFNGEWTAKRGEGASCTWTVDGGTTDSVVGGTINWYDTPTRRLAAAFTAAEGSFGGVVDVPEGCCGGLTIAAPVWYISGAAGTPPVLTVTPLGPCDPCARCADNTFRVRVRCQTGSLPCDSQTRHLCLTVRRYGQPDETVPVVVAPATSILVENFITGNGGEWAEDPQFIYTCGLRMAMEGVPNHTDFVGDGYQYLQIYFDPDAGNGCGGWVYRYTGTHFQGFETPGDVLPALVVPDEADDPWEMVFGHADDPNAYVWPVLILSKKCPPAPIPPPGCCDAPGEPMAGPDLPSLMFNIPDGSYANEWGPIVHVTNGGNGSQAGWFVNEGGFIYCDAGTWYASSIDGATVTPALSVSCAPFGIVFPGTVWGSSGPVTVYLP